jgi:hypothetical protein
MIMSPGPRKLALTLHVTSSIGWFGAVTAFLALAIVGLTSRDALQVRAAYLAMEITTKFAIVPLAAVSLLSGIVASLGTKWGLFRYYWVLLKLVITLGATFVLLIHLQPIELLASAAVRTEPFSASLHSRQVNMLVASAAALVVLVVLTALSVHKPRGLTPYGHRKQDEQFGESAPMPGAAVS